MGSTRKKTIHRKENDALIAAFVKHRVLEDDVKEFSVVKANRPVLYAFATSLKGRLLAEATDEDYLAYLAAKREKSPASFNTQLTALQKFRDFIELPRLKKKHMKVPAHPKIPNLQQWLNIADQIEAEAAKSCIADQVLIVLMSQGGVSREDVAAMTREKFTINNDLGYVQLDYNRLKTGEPACVAFRKHCGLIAKFLEPFKPGDFLFHAKRGRTLGKRLAPGGVSQIVKRLATPVGHPEWHPHKFRHMVATKLANDGDTIYDLCNTLGWKPSSNMANVYVNLSSENTVRKHLEREGVVKPRETIAKQIKACWRCGKPVSGTRCDYCGAVSDNGAIIAMQKQMEQMMKTLDAAGIIIIGDRSIAKDRVVTTKEIEKLGNVCQT